MQNQTDASAQIHQHLANKSAGERVDLLMDLLQQVDEPTRRRFWERLAPPGLATADLRYPSPEAFLTQVRTFVSAAADGEYYDDEAAEYYGEDPADRSYHVERGYIDAYDIEYHTGMSILRTLLAEAGSYYEAGRFDVAADAYEQLLGLLLPDRGYDLCAHFRLRYPDLYMPLLEGCAAREAWTEVLSFGAEALNLPPRPRDYRYIGRDQLPNLDPNVVRDRMAWAQEQSGDLPAAFAQRRAAFEHSAGFENYQTALGLARQIGESEARQYTSEVIAHLQPEARRRSLLCQVYLYDGDYESAFGVVQNLSGYDALDALKLVAKAHLLAALHGQRVEGRYLPKIRTDLDSSLANEYARFLRDDLPMPDLTPTQRAEYIRRAEHLYVAILETHIAAGSKRYKTAAYYCALLAEIAVHAEHVDEFVAWYEDLLTRNRRKTSLRGILDAQTQPVLQAARKRRA